MVVGSPADEETLGGAGEVRWRVYLLLTRLMRWKRAKGAVVDVKEMVGKVISEERVTAEEV